MIQEDYTSFKTSILLKEKGFNERCRYVYMPDGTRVAAQIFMEGESSVDNDDIESVARYNDWIPYTQGEYAYLCPTQQVAMKWLREKHNICIIVDICFNDARNREPGFVFEIWTLTTPYDCLDVPTDAFNTYEEAAEEAIRFCLIDILPRMNSRVS